MYKEAQHSDILTLERSFEWLGQQAHIHLLYSALTVVALGLILMLHNVTWSLYFMEQLWRALLDPKFHSKNIFVLNQKSLLPYFKTFLDTKRGGIASVLELKFHFKAIEVVHPTPTQRKMELQ